MKKGIYILIILLSIVTGINLLLMIIKGIPIEFIVQRDGNLLFYIAFYSYIFYSGIALIVGSSLFSKQLKNRNYRIQKQLSKIYLISALIGSVGGFYLGFFTSHGLGAKIGFITLNALWFISSLVTFLNFRKEDATAYKQTLMYSFSIVFSVVTFNMWLPPLAYLLNDYEVAYAVAVWESWLPNVFISFMVIRRNK